VSTGAWSDALGSCGVSVCAATGAAANAAAITHALADATRFMLLIPSCPVIRRLPDADRRGASRIGP
jgi:hypothetical protein